MKDIFVRVLAGLLLVVPGSPALADLASVADPKDTNDPYMDLAEVTHDHGRKHLIHTIRTHEAWTNDRFIGAEIDFWLPDGDPERDRRLFIYLNPDGSFAAQMLGDGGARRGFANAFRTDDRTLQLEFPVRLLKRGIDRYRWKAMLLYDPCRDVEPGGPPGCHSEEDTHDEKRRILHEL